MDTGKGIFQQIEGKDTKEIVNKTKKESNENN